MKREEKNSPIGPCDVAECPRVWLVVVYIRDGNAVKHSVKLCATHYKEFKAGNLQHFEDEMKHTFTIKATVHTKSDQDAEAKRRKLGELLEKHARSLLAVEGLVLDKIVVENGSTREP
jgi:hypothetical protein